MTLGLDATDTLPEIGSGFDQVHVLSGKLIGIRYLVRAVQRRKRLWMAMALVGLLLGAGFHTVVPRKYTAYATLYLAHAPGTDDAVGMGNDLALLNNTSVARQAIKVLHEPSLDPTKFLGKLPGVSVSANVLTISMNGPSYSEAVRRANAVTSGYLTFRAHQYNAQDDAIVSGLNKQVGSLREQANKLTDTIDGSGLSSQQLTQLVDQRSQDGTEIANLQQTIQQDQLNALSVVNASRVLTSGTAVFTSSKKILIINGLSGLGCGLIIGLGFVVLQALVSDRVRTREDVATLLGASVEVSAPPLRSSWLDELRSRLGLRPNRNGRASHRPGPHVRPVFRYLRARLGADNRRSLLTVAVDDATLPAISLAAVAGSLAADNAVVLVDLTAERVFQSMFSCNGERINRVQIGSNAITLFVPSDLGPEDERAAWELSAERWPQADVVLALATVDISRGAWHLRSWTKAVVTVTAGRSTPQRISATAELLRASGVAVASAVLFDADPGDESVGLHDAAGPRGSMLDVNSVTSAALP
jgi:capsular polysaccharide biosynthesis protein